MLKLVVTDRAEQTLNEIIDFYLTEYTIERTEKVLSSIDNAFLEIIQRPKLYPICFSVKIPQENIRQYIVHNTFKIIYRIQTDVIEIIEIFHGSRNPILLEDIE